MLRYAALAFSARYSRRRGLSLFALRDEGAHGSGARCRDLAATDEECRRATRDHGRRLGYIGSMDDSATMNIWLHKAVFKKLSENGGKVPADLLD